MNIKQKDNIDKYTHKVLQQAMSNLSHTPPQKTVHLEVPNRTELIVSALIEYISLAGMEPGHKLPSSDKLCEILGVVSRSLREALISLKSLGVVQSRHGTGWFIEKFDPVNSLRFLSPLIQNFSGADLEQIIDTRLTIEPRIAKLAAENISQQGMEDLSWIFQQMKESTSEIGIFKNRDIYIFDELYIISNSRKFL